MSEISRKKVEVKRIKISPYLEERWYGYCGCGIEVKYGQKVCKYCKNELVWPKMENLP